MHVPPILRGSHQWPDDGPPTVVTIGNFDGVHLGHRALLDRTRTLAAAHQARACAFTFDPPPRDVLRPDNAIQRIQRLQDRTAMLLDAGVDHVIVEPFTLAYAAHDARWFAEEILRRRLGAVAVVVGWDFRFGKGRGGTAGTLREALDAPVEQIQAYRLDGEAVSSSRIRQALQRGEVAVASTLLGRPHRVVGTVVRGDARGRDLGFPTANIKSQTPLVPAEGVYAVRVRLADQTVRKGVANLGARPTFGGGPPTLEVHLFDFDGDLYGATLAVDFIGRIRDERRFEDRTALVEQIRHDAQAARDLLRASS